ncbi:hypothetical protein J5N97_002342 [Dioscorea zingiberensis]|uniref:Dof zinc finger protein n=1 Tax=Dioscorea zingiberensis TaxID=325984 RepID=A0A9D5HPI8_9LILI|nr:hypothetical protein J5N97_002342 [Dioscorea zingiberensis]
MVFSSLPLYLDPPNWNQQQGNNGGAVAGVDSNQFPPSNTAANSRPGSMTERARLAKVPQPEQALKCPRCDSSNTKFCYFNNYSLTQPRHFCKTCRRYWTRGGALRNVPVGGGCRRNKRSKSGGGSASKSSSAPALASSSSSAAMTAVNGVIPSPAPHQLPFMASLHSLSDYGAANLGLNFTGMQPIDHHHGAHEYQVGSTSVSSVEQWRQIQQMPQLPFLGGLEPPGPMSVAGLFQFEGFQGDVHQKQSNSGLITQLASVKMEENSLGRLSFQRQYSGVPGSDNYWNGSAGVGSNGNGGSGWATDFSSGFNSSVSGSLL